MSSVTIRRLVPEDLEDAFYDAFESVAAEGRWVATEVPFDRDKRRRQALEGLQKETIHFLVVENEGRIIGGLGLHQVIPGLYSLGMFLIKGFRGQGIGRELMAQALELARELGAYKLTLEVWPHNEPAIRLYESLGFEREGYLKQHYRRKNGEIWDAIVMGLVLGSGATAPAMKRGRQ